MPKLVLTRKPGQSVRVGAKSKVTLEEGPRGGLYLNIRVPATLGRSVDLGGSQIEITESDPDQRKVKIAFQAPANVTILREELVG